MISKLFNRTFSNENTNVKTYVIRALELTQHSNAVPTSDLLRIVRSVRCRFFFIDRARAQ